MGCVKVFTLTKNGDDSWFISIGLYLYWYEVFWVESKSKTMKVRPNVGLRQMSGQYHTNVEWRRFIICNMVSEPCPNGHLAMEMCESTLNCLMG